MIKNKFLSTLVVVALSITTVISPLTTTVFATEQLGVVQAYTKSFNISCNGREIKVPAYVINDNSYFRIADIANALDMKISPGYGKDKKGVMLYTDRPYEGNIAPISNEEKKDQLTPLFYNGLWVGSAGEGQVKAINVGDRNYVMVRDVAEIAKMNYDKWDTYYREKAKLSEEEYASHRLPTLTYFSVDWNEATQTVIFNTHSLNTKDYRNNTLPSIKSNNTITQTKTGNDTKEVKVQGTGPLTSAPKEGITLAKILKDPSMTDLYGSDGVLTDEGYNNFTDLYRGGGAIGQCTWYARDRFIEVNGIDIEEGEGIGGTSRMLDGAEKNKVGILKVIRDADNIVANSLAVWNGHVVYVEYVERDAEGKPTYVYFTEGNGTGTDRFVPGKDGAVKKMTFSSFIVRGDYWDKNGKVMGYITTTDN